MIQTNRESFKEIGNLKIGVVIPYYNAANKILSVVQKIPNLVQTIIIVDDQSKDQIPRDKIIQEIKQTQELILLKNPINLGVGGATKTGFKYAIDQNLDIVIKIDADDQMDLSYIPKMLEYIISGKCHVCKGNRFRDMKALSKMPIVRRFGNLFLSFMIKAATGYWNNFDPTNGYIAIKVDSLKKINFENLSNRYYFETSLLAELYFYQTKIKDISMPAIYGDEKSSMNLWKMPFEFGFKIMRTFIKRIVKQYFLYDFNIASIYILFGYPLFLFGLIFGFYEWYIYSTQNLFAPTGTIMIATLSLILGFQFILQAIQFDIIKAPTVKK